MKKTLAKILGITIILTMILHSISGFTIALTEKEQLENEKRENEKEMQEMKKKQEKLEAEKSETMKAVEGLISKITTAEDEIDVLESKVNTLKSQIQTKEKDIQQKETEYIEQEKLLDARLIAMSEKGEITYLDAILTATSLTDFLTKYYYASELVESDKNLLKQTKEQKEQIQKEKSELEENKKELDTSLSKAKAKRTELNSLKQSKQNYADKLTEQEKELQKEIEEREQANKELQKKIREAEIRYQKQLEELRKQQQGNTVAGSGYFIRPVGTGSVTARAYYSSGRFHGGVDYGIPVGTTVKAAADGVVMSTADLSSSYGTYVVIRHANGLQTYYAHGTRGSICVQPGQIVKQGEKIMLSGNTGNSTGPHLHFEVRVSPYNYKSGATGYGQDSRVNPENYL